MGALNLFLKWISDLRVAIFLLILIAITSGLGTTIPQGESVEKYLETYNKTPWFGILNGRHILAFQLDHIYTSSWFLGLLIWLGTALLVCSWRRQLPALLAGLRWIDYQKPEQLSKLAIAESVKVESIEEGLKDLASQLRKEGWHTNEKDGRLAARKGVVGRIGPPLVHIGMVLLMIGAAWGALGGQKTERFLTQGKSFELLNNQGQNQLTINLSNFEIDRDSAGRPNQFRSKLELIQPDDINRSIKEISVNHPLRFQGMTIYQADWSLAAVTIKIGDSPKLQLPLQAFPELGDQVWGLIFPSSLESNEPLLLTVSNELGPIQIYDSNGQLVTSLRPGGQSAFIDGIDIKVISVLPASGLLLKRDPGVPLVYTGFAILLLGGGLSIISTRQIWVITDPAQSTLHLGGLSNRNLVGLATELPKLISKTIKA